MEVKKRATMFWPFQLNRKSNISLPDQLPTGGGGVKRLNDEDEHFVNVLFPTIYRLRDRGLPLECIDWKGFLSRQVKAVKN